MSTRPRPLTEADYDDYEHDEDDPPPPAGERCGVCGLELGYPGDCVAGGRSDCPQQ